MSTIYVFNDELSALSTAATNDVLLIHDTSAGTKADVTVSVLQSAILGNTSTGPVGFFGATGVGRYANSIAQPASTASVSISATQHGFATSTQADALILAVHRMASMSVWYGLATSA